MTYRPRYICKLPWEMNFYDGIINLEKTKIICEMDVNT